jgi:hypothetical protein
VKGYVENGQKIPATTNFAGLYARTAEQDNKPPFDLPASWIAKKSALDLTVPFNFVSTADIIGGNSGSPVVNAAGELVGVIFDGNIDSLVLNVAYDDRRARAVAVDAAGVVAALEKVYAADALLEELLTAGAGPR